RQTRLAQKSALNADWQRSFAVMSSQDAELQKHLAEQSAARADEQRKLANAQRRLAESREIAAHAEAEMNRDPGLAILLAFEALRRDDSPEARSALLEASRFAWPTTSIRARDDLGSRAAAIALSPDGARLAVASEDGAVSLWNVT